MEWVRGAHARDGGRLICVCTLWGLFGLLTAASAFGQRDEGTGDKAQAARGERAAQHKEIPVAYEPLVLDGSRLVQGCETCDLLHISGEPYASPGGGVATPVGTTYSVSHRVGADYDAGGPQGVTCLFINQPGNPGAPDDIVSFDTVEEPIRTDILGTVPKVDEEDDPLPNGRRLITITTSSPVGTDLFPGGLIFGGHEHTDACFTVGLEDALTWGGSDTVHSASIEYLINGVVQLGGPLDASSFFTDPWNGQATIVLPNGAGEGYNGVRLEIVVEKSIQLPNDGCRGQIEVFDGPTPYSTIGSSTDGPNEPADCFSASYSDIGSDIWYRYEATCTGNLTVDLCNSNYDTKFAVYDGCLQCPISPGPLVCNDDFCGVRSRASAPVVEGECYTIRLGGYFGYQGSGTMNLSCNVIPPPTGACCDDDGDCVGTITEEACQGSLGTWFEGLTCPTFLCPVSKPIHNECENCLRVETGVPVTRSTRAATGTDLTPPVCGDADSIDVWHCWTASCSGHVTISTCGSFFDTTLAVFDECNGTRLACDDDSCSAGAPDSQLELEVTEGATYVIRIAGYGGAFGNYTLTVEDCRNACCFPNGTCELGTESECAGVNGTHLGPGTECRGDLDGNSVDDACEECPQATIAAAAPDDGTVDARQPNARNAALPRQGIGSPGGAGSRRETIVIVLDPPVADAADCFSLCETGVDPLAGANSISEVSYHGDGVYEIALAHAIPAGRVTTIEYLGDGSFVEYIAHPSNVDGGPVANASDVQKHLDCCLRGTCTPEWGAHSCDTDRSTKVTPADTLFVVDLQNGTQLWDSWGGPPLSTLPTNASCP